MKRLWAKIRSFFKKKQEKPMTFEFFDSYRTFVEDWARTNISVFNSATDIEKLTPNWSKHSTENKAKIIAEFYKWISFYESGWNPRLQGVDVGKKEDKNTWSIGLMQMSVIDQTSYRTSTKYTYDDLLSGIHNLHLSLLVMQRMIVNKGKIFRAVGESGYWAVIIEGGKFQKISQIINKVRAFEATLQKMPEVDDVPWKKIAEGEIGISEKNPGHNARIVEYHQATSLKAKDDETAWCASFACWVLEKAGYKSTKSAWAREFLNYGTKLSAPKPWCIMVFERGSKGGTSHVTFWTGKENPLGYECLGGNQGDSVNRSYYSKKDFLGARWPTKG